MLAIKGCERLRPAIRLKRHDSMMVQPHTREVQEKLRRHKRKVTSDHDGPFTTTSRESSMNTAQCTPLCINIRDVLERRHRRWADYRDRVSELQQCIRDSFDEALALDEQLRFVRSHSSRGTACENKGINIEKGFHDFEDYPVYLVNPEIL